MDKRTSFLQIPNVFFETCALPESAQILFLRIAAQIGKQQQKVFTGSMRQLATLVRMSKSTVDRMLDVLIDSELITVTLSAGIESSREVMSIEANMDRLWELNTYHNTVSPVPIWDTILPNCPNLGHDIPDRDATSQNEAVMSQIEYSVSQAQAQIRDNTLNTEKTNEEERKTPAPASSTPEPSFPLSSSPDSLLKKLTDEQADFWQRWCALTGSTFDTLKESALSDVEWLAERITTTADLDSLYQSNAAMLLELSQAKGTPYTPPHLRNLVKHYPTWHQAESQRQKRAEQASTKAPSGTGAVRNLTAERLAGNAPPLVYGPPPERKRPTRTSDSMGIGRELAAMREKLGR